MTLEERLEKLERYHRRRWFRRAVKVSLFIAILLLLLWLIMDALHLGMVVDALQRQIVDNNNLINEVHSQVTNLQNVANGLTVKINGVIQSYTHNSTQLNTQSVVHNGTHSMHNLSPVLASGAAGGIAATIINILRVLSMAV